MKLFRTSLFFIIYLLVLAPPASAQRGEFIEGLFRTIAEAQVEREQRRDLPADPRVDPRYRNTNDPRVLPNTNLPNTGPTRNVPVAPSSAAGNPNVISRAQVPSINVRSREAADFAQELVDFYVTVDGLVGELRTATTQNANLRPLLPSAYQISADSRTVIQSCDGIVVLDPIVPAFANLDSKWRQLSFNLRSMGGLSNNATQAIRRADQLVASMERRLKLGPQFDRLRLRDLMVVGSTCMDTLIDDIQLASIPSKQADELVRDCRVLQQQLLNQSQRVAEGSYEEVVSTFTDFAGAWSALGRRIGAIDDMHLHRRLDRIRECGNQTYALLWIPPPASSIDVRGASQRLERRVGEMLDQLTLRTMVALKPGDQPRVLESSRRLYDQCQQLETATARNAPPRELTAIFTGIDRDWSGLRASYQQMGTLPNGMLWEIDQVCEQMRSALNVSPSIGGAIDFEELLQSAASLQGAAEYFDADIDRFSRYVSNNAARQSLQDNSKDFFIHAKRIHSQLSGRANLPDLQREASHLVDGWEHLNNDLRDLARQGVPVRSAESLQRAHRDMAPFVAQLGAALLER